MTLVNYMIISIIGLGFVGSAMKKCFEEKNILMRNYDKFKDVGSIEQTLMSDICFLCLPTLYDETINGYDLTPIHETFKYLQDNHYAGIVVVKSTVEPLTCNKLKDKYQLNILHNPEFLSAKTAFEDLKNQNHIVIGLTDEISENTKLHDFYRTHFKHAEISTCTSVESECMKLFCNSFYAVKIQYFNELYLLSNKLDANFNNIRNMMLKNGWIHQNHTCVPGHDGKLSYGGDCFPKDTNALASFMKKQDSMCNVLTATIKERNLLRNEQS